MTAGRARGVAAEARRFLRANLSAAIASGLEWLLVTGLVIAGVHYLLAAAAGALTGAAIDFSLKRHWAFDRARRAGIGHEGLRYLVVSAASLALNVAASYGLVDGLGAPEVPGVIAASLLVGFAWNYPLHRLYVFRGVGPPASDVRGARAPPRLGRPAEPAYTRPGKGPPA